MSSGRLVVSQRARDDLKSIEAYIGEHDGEARAAAFTARVETCMRNLALMPGIGSSRRYLKPGRRAFSVAPWLIIYIPLPDGVRILRVVDGRRDLSALFGRKP